MDNQRKITKQCWSTKMMKLQTISKWSLKKKILFLSLYSLCKKLQNLACWDSSAYSIPKARFHMSFSHKKNNAGFHSNCSIYNTFIRCGWYQFSFRRVCLGPCILYFFQQSFAKVQPTSFHGNCYTSIEYWAY